MSQQIERALQHECWVRLKFAPLDALVIPIPNGLWVPIHDRPRSTGSGHMTGGIWQGGQQRKLTPQELLVARLINRMKADGMLIPGAPDWLVASATSCRTIEFKRPATKTLLGRAPKGRLSPAQIEFNTRLDRVGIEHVEVYSWEECRGHLVEWGLLPASWGGTPVATPTARRKSTFDDDIDGLFR